MTHYELPSDTQDWIEKHLRNLGYSLSNSKALAPGIMKISDHYQSQDSITDWSTRELKAAYLAYFYPLNLIRSLKVIDEALRVGFFDGVQHMIDFGCGPGTITKALMINDIPGVESILGVDHNREVGAYFLDTKRKAVDLSFSPKLPANPKQHQALLAAYTFNELPSIEAALAYDRVMIIEASTRQNWDSFKNTRELLIEKGFNILAPCTHQKECPLATSKKDWCHDRVYWHKPAWFAELEKHLPIKNDSMTFSYLIAARDKDHTTKGARIVGDAQVEKGKTRWMICQSEQREFMAFLKRHGKPPKLYRGERIQFDGCEKKGNEWRLEPGQFEVLKD